LDCGCPPERHAWVFGKLGAKVTAFDLAENALNMAKEACSKFPNVKIYTQSIKKPLPFDIDYDLVWCYGVLHHTGQTFEALKNIAKHVRPGETMHNIIAQKAISV
jgi:2-polyprenyl-3-methyl-5-hydroxy-6-metoxy-1,4-benzoquinol methylase